MSDTTPSTSDLVSDNQQWLDLVHNNDRFTVYTHCGEIDRLINTYGESKNSAEALQTAERIRSMYYDGVPFFTKQAIRDVLKQSRSDSREIVVRAIDGSPVSFRRDTGEVKPCDDEHHFLIEEPFIHFMPVQHMLSFVHRYNPQLSLCSMWVYHRLTKRRTLTNEPLRPQWEHPLSKVAQFFQYHCERWEASESCKRLRMLLSEKVDAKIDKIVAFGCGDMAYFIDLPHADVRAYQHAIILTIRDIVTSRHSHRHTNKVQCYAQDPGHRDIDRRVLESHGIVAVNCPDGFLEVDDSTVVLSFDPEAPVRQVIADIARPRMMIWDQSHSKSTRQIENDASPDADPPRLVKMLHESYIEIHFPGDLKAFDHSTIFIKKEED